MARRVSRQTVSNRQRSVETLRQRADAAPIVIAYDNALGQYVIHWIDDPDTLLIGGRFEVAAAYVEGFVRAWINRPPRES